MTPRQQRIAQFVQRQREDIIAAAQAELQAQPIGYSAVLRFYPSFLEPQITLLVTKLPNGFSWVDHNPLFYNWKGRQAPKPRLLVGAGGQ